MGKCHLGASVMEELYPGTGGCSLPIAQLFPLPTPTRSNFMTLVSIEGICEENGRRRRKKSLLKSPAAAMALSRAGFLSLCCNINHVQV